MVGPHKATYIHLKPNVHKTVFWRKGKGFITCISCLTRITHITLRTMMIAGKGAKPHNAYNMHYTHNTYNTQYKVYWRRRVGLITCITCITRISRITLRLMIKRKGLNLIRRLTCIWSPVFIRHSFQEKRDGAHNVHIMPNTHNTHSTQNNYDRRKGGRTSQRV